MELLTHSETLQLIKKAQAGDMDARAVLVEKNAALVKSIARRFLNRGAEYDDLIQVGSIGLLKAIDGFDPSFDVRFSTYAVPMIAGDIKRFLRDDGTLKVSRSLKEAASRAMRTAEELKRELGREATIEEISSRMGMPREDVVFAMEAMAPVTSIYELAFDGDDSKTQVIDLIEDEKQTDVVDRIMLRQMLARLNERERKLILLRFFGDKTQTQIADIMGVSQVQVSRQLSKTITKLREMAVK